MDVQSPNMVDLNALTLKDLKRLYNQKLYGTYKETFKRCSAASAANISPEKKRKAALDYYYRHKDEIIAKQRQKRAERRMMKNKVISVEQTV
jgi:hypothetical protein